MKKKEILHKLKENKANLEKNFNISKIGLYGSYASGEARPDSDIDILYELKTGIREGISDIYNLEVFFQQLLDGRKIDLVNSKFMNPIIADEIRNTIIYV